MRLPLASLEHIELADVPQQAGGDGAPVMVIVLEEADQLECAMIDQELDDDFEVLHLSDSEGEFSYAQAAEPFWSARTISNFLGLKALPAIVDRAAPSDRSAPCDRPPIELVLQRHCHPSA